MSTTTRNALFTDPSYQPTLAVWNWLVHVAGAAYKSELSARTVFESELFGMNTYILMSMMEDYRRVPERIAVIRRHATPAELVTKALPIGTKRSFINLAAMPLHYLTAASCSSTWVRTSWPTGWTTSSRC